MGIIILIALIFLGTFSMVVGIGLIVLLIALLIK